MIRHSLMGSLFAAMLFAVACGDGGPGNGRAWTGTGEPVGNWTEKPGSSSEQPGSASEQPESASEPPESSPESPGFSSGGLDKPGGSSPCSVACKKIVALECSRDEGLSMAQCLQGCASLSAKYEHCAPEVANLLRKCDFACNNWDEVVPVGQTCMSEGEAMWDCDRDFFGDF